VAASHPSNPLRIGSSAPSQEIATGNFLGAELPSAILRIEPGGGNLWNKLPIRESLKTFLI
jgi:hypothetical protein